MLRVWVMVLLMLPWAAMAQRYDFRAWGVDEGMPRSSVLHLAQDPSGLLWVATEGGGVAAFDGHSFRNFNIGNGLASNTVRCLLPLPNGEVWMGTDGQGISLLRNGQFSSINTTNGLPSGHVRSLCQGPDGRIWAGTFGAGIVVLDPKPDTTLIVRITDADGLPHLKVRALLCDSKGRVWAGTDGGLCVFDKNSMRARVVDGLIDPKVHCLFEDDQHAIWVGTEHGAVRILEDSLRIYMDEDGLIDPRIRSIGQDASGHMWFATQKGLWYVDGGVFRLITEANGLSNARVRHMVRDRSGNMWFGTLFGGICRMSGADMTLFRARDGLVANQVSAVLAERDTIWAGTLIGLSVLLRDSSANWAVARNLTFDELNGQQINTIVRKSPTELWVGTDAGIDILGPKGTQFFSPDGQLFTDEVRAIHFATNGKVWVGSSQGITSYTWNGTEYAFSDFWSESNANESEVSTIYEDAQGRIWAGFTRAAVVRFADGQFSIPAPIGTLRGIAHIVGGPTGEVVIATHSAGIHVVGASGTTVNQITTTHGLANADVNLVAFDQQGRLWAGSSTGMDVITLAQGMQIEGVRHLGTNEGFYGTETFDRSISLGPDGTLWVGTVRGLTRLGTAPDARKALPPLTHLARVVTGSGTELRSVLPGQFGSGHVFQVGYADNTLLIDYTGIDLSYPEKVRFQWRIVGLFDDWSPPTAQRTQQIENIPPGTYTFEVRACNGTGLCDTEAEQFTITVAPPFWRTWWFIFLMMVCGTGVVIATIRYRERRARAERERLQHMVDDRTRDLTAEKQRSDDLLHNILPHEVAQELKEKGAAEARHMDQVTVLFTDFKGFTELSAQVTPQALVAELNRCFSEFDRICHKHGIEKIKTIGDAFMAAGGLPTPNSTHAVDVVRAALEMRDFIDQRTEQPSSLGPHPSSLQVRIGIHTGPVVAGIVGIKKFQYDIWGDTVNTASRMESSGQPGQVNISDATHAIVKDQFACTYRGEVEAKGKGKLGMWFVSNEI